MEDSPRFVRINRLEMKLFSYLPFPDKASGASYAEGFRVEFITITNRKLSLPGRAQKSWLMAHDGQGGQVVSSFVEAVLPKGHEVIKGFQLFGQDGNLLCEQYFNPHEPTPDIEIEVNDPGDVLLYYTGRIDYWDVKVSADQGRTWSKPMRPANYRWNRILDDAKNRMKLGVMLEFTLVRNFKVEKRRMRFDSPQKGTLNSLTYIRD